MTADAVLRSLRHVWKTLDPLGLPMAVMGGLALATWKCVRATQDVDLLVGIGHRDLEGLLKLLRASAIRPKRDPPVTALGQLDIVQLLYEPPESFIDLQIDLLLARSGYHLESLARRVPTRLSDGLQVAVLACEDMILHKLLAGRIIDRADAVSLLRANHNALELDYLAGWAAELGLLDELAGLWKESVPGELPAELRQ